MKSALFFIAAFAAFASVSAHATKLQPASSRSTPRRPVPSASRHRPVRRTGWALRSEQSLGGPAAGYRQRKGKNIATASGAVLGSQVGPRSPVTVWTARAAMPSSGGQAAQRLPDQNDRGNTVFVPTYLMQAR